jgi:hypothetical protein
MHETYKPHMMIRPLLLIAVVMTLATAAAQGDARGGTTAVGGAPVAIVGAGDDLWVLTCDRGCAGRAEHSQGRIVHIDARTARVIRSARIERPGALALAPTGLMITDFWGNAVRLFDRRTLRAVARLKLVLPFAVTRNDRAFAPFAIASANNSAWVSTARGALARVDPHLARVLRTVRLPADATGDLAAGLGGVWVAESLAGVYRVRPSTNKVAARIRVGTRDKRLSVERVFLAHGNVLGLGAETSSGAPNGANGIAVIDPTNNRVRFHAALPPGPLAATSGGGWLWIGRFGGSELDRIDPLTGKISQRFPARIGVALAFAHREVWTADARGLVRRLSTS